LAVLATAAGGSPICQSETMTGFRAVATRRLALAAGTVADLDDFHALHRRPVSDSPQTGGLSRDHSLSLLEAIAEDWNEVGLGYWTLRDLSGRFVGIAGVRRIGPPRRRAPEAQTQPPPHTFWNLYYRIEPARQGNGYGREAVVAAAGAAEQHTPGSTLQAMIRPGNRPSRGLAEAVGMLQAGSERDPAGVVHVLYQLEAWVFGPA
jgi:RimJ/RimL family protein N-acetyltransferase